MSTQYYLATGTTIVTIIIIMQSFYFDLLFTILFWFSTL